jgi:hypothetical protein
MVAVVASARNVQARTPAARVRLNAIAAHISQAALAVNPPCLSLNATRRRRGRALGHPLMMT